MKAVFKKMTAWFSRKWKVRADTAMPERAVVVRFDDCGLSVSYPGGSVQTLAWAEVDRIAIETNDSGPWGADVWWLIEGSATRCIYPHGATGDSEAMMEYARRFPSFSHEAVIGAMGSTSNARFVCWEK